MICCPYCGSHLGAPPPPLDQRYMRPGRNERRCTIPCCAAIVPAHTVDRKGRCRRCQRIAGSARQRKRVRAYRRSRRAAAIREAQ